jgi:crotonobetainyl-CoA:carnitine CoA-transferase CaiB-like acyl-CoA transferase
MRTRNPPETFGPLSDIRIIDLSRLVAGNMVTHVLADMGADVVKVERPLRGDDLRGWRVKDVEVFWKTYSRNKRSIGLDLKQESDRQILIQLLGSAHALVENFVPGTLEQMGLSPETLLQINPRLVIVRLSGWGQTGPYRQKPGFGTLVEAMSGFADLNGFADSPPCLPPLATADMIAGLYAAVGLLAALRSVEAHAGRGQVVDVSLFEPIFSLISVAAAHYRLNRVPMRRNGNQSTHTAPRNIYACSDGHYVALSGSMQSMAEKIFRTIGRPDLIDDPRFRGNDDRLANSDALDGIIGAFIAKHSRAENLSLFEAAGVTVGPVCSVAELIDHPYVVGREVLIEMTDAEGSLPMHNVVVRFSATPGSIRRSAPAVDQDREAILAELEQQQGAKQGAAQSVNRTAAR